MLLKLLLFVLISTLLPACTWFSGSTGSTAGEEIAKPMELLNAEQFQPQDTNNPPLSGAVSRVTGGYPRTPGSEHPAARD
jgi:hypothetical protein